MRWACLVALLLVAIAALPAGGANAAQGSRFAPGASGTLGVVATESPAASRVGRQVLEEGGNAMDAAAATVFAIGVARPQSCGIGGGGFLVYRSKTGATRALDFRETAPAAIRPDAFTGPGLHREFTGHKTVGVPGTVAGMDSALRRYGTRSLAQSIAPAERLARRGFRVPTSLSTATAANLERLQLFGATRAQYLRDGNRPYAPGETLRQPDLAASLRRIQRGGRDAFYRGTIARRIVRDMRTPRPETRDPGLMTLRDLAAYRAVWRPPIRGSYRGHRIIAMPPPTSGGIAVVEMLNILSAFDLPSTGQSSADALHLLAEAQKIAFADRNAYVADTDFEPDVTARLTAPVYGGARSRDIDLARAQRHGPGLGEVRAAPRGARTGDNPTGTTTHISIVDREGAAVSVTCTIEQEYGSAVIAPGTGFLLNNQLTDFGAPGTANEAEPGKRPRSSMAPTIVVSPSGRPTLVVGGAGGARIIMGTLLPIVNTIDFGLGVASAVDAERIEAAGTSLLVEDARIPLDVLADLERRGHSLTREGEYAVRPRIQAAGEERITPGLPPDPVRRVAVSDPRTDQAALAVRERSR